uniref:Helix-turn-helix domain protein n=1 Tax=Sphingobacterium sp. (strain 21) TaxID=743722 RepID=F4CF52_SPHS2
MKVGDNIREIRETEKNFKRSYMADRLNISERAYGNIENNVTDISLTRLEEIASIFECSPEYILNYKQSKKEFYNYFHNKSGNKGTNIMHQGTGVESESNKKILKLQEELLESERKRISLLEALLKNNNIEF